MGLLKLISNILHIIHFKTIGSNTEGSLEDDTHFTLKFYGCDVLTVRTDEGHPYHMYHALDTLQDPGISPEIIYIRRPPERCQTLGDAHIRLRKQCEGPAHREIDIVKERLRSAYSRSSCPTSTALENSDKSKEKAKGSKDHLQSDLLAKIINGLDTVLFAGALRGRILAYRADLSTMFLHTNSDNVSVIFALPHPSAASTSSFSSFSSTDPQKSKWRKQSSLCPVILINTQSDNVQSQATLWSSLVHAMLHIYLYLHVGYESYDYDPWATPNTNASTGTDGSTTSMNSHTNVHGPMFRQSCRFLTAKLDFAGIESKDVLSNEGAKEGKGCLVVTDAVTKHESGGRTEIELAFELMEWSKLAEAGVEHV